MTTYIGIDDTDTRESRGTGRLARAIAAELSRSYGIFGVTRHQLFLHPSIPYTSHNSAAVIHILERENGVTADDLFETAKELLLADFIEGSDPGICIAADRQMGQEVSRFGFIAKREVVTGRGAHVRPSGRDTPRRAWRHRRRGYRRAGRCLPRGIGERRSVCPEGDYTKPARNLNRGRNPRLRRRPGDDPGWCCRQRRPRLPEKVPKTRLCRR